MKTFKILGLLGFVAAAMMSFAASASADQVSTTTGGAAATPSFHAVSENGHITLSNPIANISCNATANGNVTSHGAGQAVGIPTGHFTFTGCTNSWHVTTESAAGSGGGVFAIEHTSGHNGTVFSYFTRIHATRFGISCVYETLGTHIGTLTGGSFATLDIEDAAIPIDEGASSGLCGSSDAGLEGAFVTTSGLYVANS